MKTRNKALLLVLCAVMLVVASVVGTIAYFTDSESVVNTFAVGKVGLKLDEAKVNEVGQPIDEDGNVVEDLAKAKRVIENSYHLLPGHTYTKDPTVTVDAGSDEAYVRMIVTVENFDQLRMALPQSEIIFADDGTTYQTVIEENQKYYSNDGTFLLQMLCVDKDGKCTWNIDSWEYKHSADNAEVGKYEFRYKTDVSDTVAKNTDATKETVLPALFTAITVPCELDNKELAYWGGANDEGVIDSNKAVKITVEAHAIQADGFENADEAWEAFDGQNK